jgi:hypothetical protein
MASQLNICNLALYQIGEDAITQAQLTAKSPRPAELCDAFWAYIRDECLEAHPWNFAKKHRPLDYADDFGLYPSGGTNNDVLTITGASQADPCVITIASHTFVTGDIIKIDDVVGMTELNDRFYEVTYINTSTFSIGVDSTKMTAYSSAGTAIRQEALSEYVDGYTYDVPSDYLRALSIDEDPDIRFQVVGKTSATNATGEEESRRLLTTVEDATLVYIAQVTDTTYWTNRFIQVMAARLAAELAGPLKKKGIKSFEEAMLRYEFLLRQASLNDASENRNPAIQANPWLTDAGY